MSETGSAPRRPYVFVMEQNPFDYSPAAVYGELRVMKGRPFTPNAPDSTWNAESLNAIKKDMLEYVAGYDYLIPTGNPSRIAVVGMVAQSKGGRHRLLQWDKRTQRYVEYHLQLNG